MENYLKGDEILYFQGEDDSTLDTLWCKFYILLRRVGAGFENALDRGNRC